MASFDFGGREMIFEVRGLLTGAEGAAVQRRPGAVGRRRGGAHRNRAGQQGAPVHAPDERAGRQPLLRDGRLGRDGATASRRSRARATS